MIVIKLVGDKDSTARKWPPKYEGVQDDFEASSSDTPRRQVQLSADQKEVSYK
jgi:hypothetical protein